MLNHSVSKSIGSLRIAVDIGGTFTDMADRKSVV